MAPNTPISLISVDIAQKPWEQEKPLHNRWHPDIPPVETVKEGTLFRVETIDWTGAVTVQFQVVAFVWAGAILRSTGPWLTWIYCAGYVLGIGTQSLLAHCPTQ